MNDFLHCWNDRGERGREGGDEAAARRLKRVIKTNFDGLSLEVGVEKGCVIFVLAASQSVG